MIMLTRLHRGERPARAALCRFVLCLGLATGLGCASLLAPAASYAYPTNLTLPTITGKAQQGQTLTESHGTWMPEPMYSAYQWLRCNSSGAECVPIAGARAQTYVPVAADVEHKLRVEETASLGYYMASESAQSAPTAVVVPPVPDDSTLPTITGKAQQGQTLTESHGTWTNSPTGFAYQWLRCNSSGAECVPIAGARAQTYVPVAEDVARELRVQETASNAGGSGSPAESQAAVVNAAASAEPPAVAPTRVLINIKSVTVNRHGVAVIPLSCPKSAADGCHGTVTITMRVAQPHARRARAARCGRGCRPLGSANYEARAGNKISLRVHIASFGRRLVTRGKSVRVTLTATSVEGGQTATVTRAIALKAAA